MRLPVVLRPEAGAEFAEAFDWYDDRRAGLGATLAGRIQESLDRIVEAPGVYELVFDGIQRAVVRQFPFTIYFKVEPNRILVLAIFHVSRNPSIWQSRV